MLGENANGDEAANNAKLYFNNILQTIKLLKNDDIKSSFKNLQTQRDEGQKKQLQKNTIAKLNQISALILKNPKLKMKFNFKKLSDDISNLSSGINKFNQDYPVEKLNLALKNDAKKEKLIELINSNDEGAAQQILQLIFKK